MITLISTHAHCKCRHVDNSRWPVKLSFSMREERRFKGLCLCHGYWCQKLHRNCWCPGIFLHRHLYREWSKKREIPSKQQFSGEKYLVYESSTASSSLEGNRLIATNAMSGWISNIKADGVRPQTTTGWLRSANRGYNLHRLTKTWQYKIRKILYLMSLDFVCNILMLVQNLV